MKPRHSAEQSTVAVNKSTALGKSGFGAAVARAGFGAAAAQAKVEIKIEEPVTYKACPVDPQERAQCDSCQ
jgi:ribonucleoside-diphosphate reductase alpha chain